MKRDFQQALRGMLKDLLHWLGDLWKSLLAIAGVVLLKVPLRGCEAMGWLEREEAYLLGRIHLLICVATLLVLGYNYIGKILAEGKVDIKPQRDGAGRQKKGRKK